MPCFARVACFGLAVIFHLGAAHAQDVPIRVVSPITPPSINNLYLHVAYEKGFFRKHVINVTNFLQVRGGPLATQALLSGQVDVTATDPEGILAAAVAGHSIKAVSAPGERLSYIVAVRKEIGSYADLKGKPFAVSRPGAISQYLLFPMLDRAGVPRDSIKFLSVGGGKERMLALLADRVKGALLHFDFAMEARADPNVKLLEPIANSVPNYPFELLVVRKDLIDCNPDAVTRITAAVIEACRFIVTDKKGTLEVFRKYSPDTSREVASAAYDGLIALKAFGVDGGMTRENMTAAMDMSLENKALEQPIPLDVWSDFRFQEEALKLVGPFKPR
jgi:NitT/TauT family transport system substrate-binding protein